MEIFLTFSHPQPHPHSQPQFLTSTSFLSSTLNLNLNLRGLYFMLSSFIEMPVWQKALELSGEVFTDSNSLPKSEDYGLTSQIRRAANSVCANIAEAFGRRTNKDKSQFYIIARGSAFETQSHLLYGEKVGYFKIEKVNLLVSEYNELIHDLNKIIKSLE
jgi:four helix bundle protein